MSSKAQSKSLIVVIITSMFFHVEIAFSQSSDDQSFETNIDFTAEEKLWIKEHPTLKATNEFDWAPIDFVQFDKPAGFSIDYLNLVTKKIGLNIEYINDYTWNELVEMARNKEVDIIHSISRNSERDSFLNYTSPYLDMPIVFFGKENAEPINNKEDLIGRTIGIVTGTAQGQYYKKTYPELNFIEYSSSINALFALSSDQIDVFPGHVPVANYIMSKNLIFDINIIGQLPSNDIGTVDKVYLATHIDNPILINILEKGMQAVSAQEYLAISRKWQTEFNTDDEFKLTEEELNWLSEHKVIKVVAAPTTPPIEILSDRLPPNGSLLRRP